HLFVGREHAPNGRDQTLKLDRFGIELVAPCSDGLLALALHRMRGHADDRMSQVCGSFLRRRTTSQRSSSGISRSIKITSGCSVAANLQPFSLFSARPSPIGLGPTMKRTGMVAVASFAALADTVPPATTIRDTRRCTRSAASSGSRAN